jgi:hypothetical protein
VPVIMCTSRFWWNVDLMRSVLKIMKCAGVRRILFSGSVATNERGSVLIYILIAVALLAALTVAFMEPSSQQSQSQNIHKTVTQIKEQVAFIQAAIQDCVLTYPAGENTALWITDAGPGGATDPDSVVSYPLKPNSTHLTSPDGNRQVKNIRCPGNPGESQDHGDIFSSAQGRFMPPPPDLFEEWQYYNGKDGVFFWTHTTKTDAFLDAALEKLDDEYADCEAEYVDASSGNIELETATSSVQCSAGSRCFRYWMVRNGAGQPSCP